MNKRIKELRLSKGLTLKEVATKIGVSESTMQRYETGAINNLKYETAVALADVLDVSPQYLLGWSDMLIATVEDYNLESLNGLLRKPNHDTSTYHLLSIYNSLNDEGKDRLIEYASLLSSSNMYK